MVKPGHPRNPNQTVFFDLFEYIENNFNLSICRVKLPN
jgi:hypothetical protein